jgi:hypothetical protein
MNYYIINKPRWPIDSNLLIDILVGLVNALIFCYKFSHLTEESCKCWQCCHSQLEDLVSTKSDVEIQNDGTLQKACSLLYLFRISDFQHDNHRMAYLNYRQYAGAILLPLIAWFFPKSLRTKQKNRQERIWSRFTEKIENYPFKQKVEPQKINYSKFEVPSPENIQELMAFLRSVPAARLAIEREEERLAAERAAAKQEELRLAAEKAAAKQEELRLAAERAAAEQKVLRLAAERAAAERAAAERAARLDEVRKELKALNLESKYPFDVVNETTKLLASGGMGALYGRAATIAYNLLACENFEDMQLLELIIEIFQSKSGNNYICIIYNK